MQSDSIKLISTYLIALVVIVGGGAMLYLTRLDADPSLSLVLAGFIGAAITFVFGQESATRAVRSYQNGLNTPTPIDPGPDVG